MTSQPNAVAGSQASLAVLAKLLEARTGQQIASSRSWRLDTALKPLLRERGLETLDQLVTQLLDGNDAAVGDLIVEALINGESSFFRDQPVFDTIAQAVTDNQRGCRSARLWSAGCATGQEPLSLAMMFAERQGDSGFRMPEIVASDVSEGALTRARAGRYTQFEIQRGLPIRRMMRWFEAEGDDWVARPELTRMVEFRRMNLVADRPPAGLFDIVLCRNVLLYLSGPSKAQVFAKLAQVLRPGGVLVLGAGETVIGQTGDFAPSLRYRGMYERVQAKARAAA